MRTSLLFATGLMACLPAFAAYPDRPVTIIVPFAAGGPTDKVGRDLAEALRKPLVRCDVPQWELFGISLAGFNAIFSLGGAVAIFALAVRGRR